MLAAPINATPAEGDVVRTDLAKGTTDAPVSIVTDGAPSALVVQGLTLKPHAGSGWHSHPGPEYSVVNSGALAVQTAGDCDGNEFTSGQAIFIPAGVVHRVANNGTQDAEAVVTYTVPADSVLREDAPDACVG